jgi:hypothetical protein
MIIDLAATNFVLVITHDFDDQSCDISTIYPGLMKKKWSHVGCKQVASLGDWDLRGCGTGVNICSQSRLSFTNFDQLKHLTKLLGLTKKPLQCKDLQIFCTWVLT